MKLCKDRVSNFDAGLWHFLQENLPAANASKPKPFSIRHVFKSFCTRNTASRRDWRDLGHKLKAADVILESLPSKRDVEDTTPKLTEANVIVKDFPRAKEEKRHTRRNSLYEFLTLEATHEVFTRAMLYFVFACVCVCVCVVYVCVLCLCVCCEAHESVSHRSIQHVETAA